MKKNVYEKVILFTTLICTSTLLALHMQEPEPRVYKGINIEGAIESASNEIVHNAGQSAETINQKIEERRIAEEEAAKKAEEEAVRRAAEEKTEVHAAKYQYGSNSSIDLRSAGIVNWGSYRFTWYSQNVLPGGGLDIPGRHVNSTGFVCDCDGFIVAATAYGRGTTGNSPWGAWKSYDTGVSGNTVDLYTNW